MSIRRQVLLALLFVLSSSASAEEQPVCETALGWCAPAGDTIQGPCACRNGDETLEGRIVARENPSPLAELKAAIRRERLTRSVLPQRTFASRGFAGPSQLPPADFKAYGVVVFKSRATRFDRDRHLMLCEAYLGVLPHSSELGADRSRQMVTIWPVARDETADTLNASSAPTPEICDAAVDEYGLVHAGNALGLLEDYRETEGDYDTSGRGPFLVAWTPGARIGEPESVALLVDLSAVERPDQAIDLLARWRDRIQDNPELWEGEVEQETLVEAIRRFFDEQGVILEALGSL